MKYKQKIGRKTNIVIKNYCRNRIKQLFFCFFLQRQEIHEVKITNITLSSFLFVFHEATTGSVTLAAWLRPLQDEDQVRKNTHLPLLLNITFCLLQVSENLLKTLAILGRDIIILRVFESHAQQINLHFVCPNLVFLKGVDNNKSRQLSFQGYSDTK